MKEAFLTTRRKTRLTILNNVEEIDANREAKLMVVVTIDAPGVAAPNYVRIVGASYRVLLGLHI